MADSGADIMDRRRNTRKRIYQYIFHSQDPVSKQQISYDLRYSLPTIHQNISVLLEQGLIKADDEQMATGGRPAVGYYAEADVKLAIGVAVTANHIRLLATNIKQEQLYYKRVESKLSDTEELGPIIAAEVEKFIEENGLDRSKILGVGITVPGMIDYDKEIIVTSPTMQLKNMEISRISSCIDFPVYLDNDGTSSGFAEWIASSDSKEKARFVYVLWDNGIGGSIFLSGKPYLGENNRSGEFGHCCIVPEGRLCNCGKRGCLEAYCGASRISKDLGLTLESFFEELKRGNSEYEKLWDEILGYMAIGLYNIRVCTDCDIVLGGAVSEYMPPYLSALKEKMLSHSSFDSNADYLRLGKFPRKAGMMGVAWHFTNEFVNSL